MLIFGILGAIVIWDSGHDCDLRFWARLWENSGDNNGEIPPFLPPPVRGLATPLTGGEREEELFLLLLLLLLSSLSLLLPLVMWL